MALDTNCGDKLRGDASRLRWCFLGGRIDVGVFELFEPSTRLQARLSEPIHS